MWGIDLISNIDNTQLVKSLLLRRPSNVGEVLSLLKGRIEHHVICRYVCISAPALVLNKITSLRDKLEGTLCH
jgi:hypothetical protein